MEKKILVMKFGGTSVGSPEAITAAAKIVKQASLNWNGVVVIVSALSGVTNLLVDCTNSPNSDESGVQDCADKLRDRHRLVIESLLPESDKRCDLIQDIDELLKEFTRLAQAMRVLGETTPRAMDAISSLGERMSVRLISEVFNYLGVPSECVESTRLIVTDENYQEAHPNLEHTRSSTRKVLIPILDSHTVPVVTGFMGATGSGITTTLGRGGSDYSAALLADALDADELWIWTDVDGVMSSDPNQVSGAFTIDELSFKEVAELAYYGARVLHPKTIRPVIEAGIDLYVKNTFNSSHPGTHITSDSSPDKRGLIKAVTAIPALSLITLEGRGMLGVPGVAARTFAAVASTGTSVPLISQASSEQSICFAVPVETAPAVVQSLEEVFRSELESRDIDRIWASQEVAIVTIVGAGMRHTPGIAGRIFSSLGDKKVNVIAIAQGSSEVSISLVIDVEDTPAGLNALHQLIRHENNS